MNKRQKEILQSQLDSEQAVLKKLKGIYKKALDDVNNNIAALMGRTDAENLQSVIYQLQYQKALKTQINGILDTLNGEQFNTIADYLSKSYEDGFAGVMYDLHGQGIPLVFPIDQDQVVRAIQHDTKLSKSLYDSLGEDVSLLKKRIQNNISRGIAQGSSYADIARNIASGMVGDYSKMRGGALGKAYTIARTEGHRITNEAAYDAQIKAKEKGADSVKKWSAALDKRTRPHHAQLDGQIREIDEPFEIDGRKAMYPGGFGVAAEDINCRCRVVSVPKWALDDDELQTLKDRAEYFGLDKTDSFEDFKQKYLDATKNVIYNGGEKIDAVRLDVSNYSKAFVTGAEKKNTQRLVDYVNSLEGSDPTALKLYNSIGKIENYEQSGIKFSISHGKNHAVGSRYYTSTGKFADVTLTVPKLTGSNISGQVNTTLHEQMHLIDLMLKDDPTKYGTYFTASRKSVVDAFQKTSDTIGKDVAELFAKHNDEYKKVVNSLKAKYDAELAVLKETYIPNGVFGAGANYKEYKKLSDKLYKNIFEVEMDYEARNIMGGGIGNLQDIYDALSGGSFRDKGTVIYGHGSKYYRGYTSRIDETIANFASLSVTRPDLIDLLRKDKPELVKVLEETIEEMVKKVDTF